MTPNILFSNTKTQSGEDTFLSIRVIRQLLKFQHELWSVPDNIQKALQELEDEKGEKQEEEIIRKYIETLKSQNLRKGFKAEAGEHGILS